MTPRGTKEEQIQYHKKEIKRYISLVNQEEHQAQRSLTRRDMLEVKRANELKAKYLEKIEEHAKAIEELQKGTSAPLTMLIADQQDHRIQSLTELKKYYVAKATRARNRANRLQYQGMLEEAEQLNREADGYDDIVKKIDDEIAREPNFKTSQ